MIITLCGSTKFKKEFERLQLGLTLQGHIVFSLASFSKYDNIELTEEEVEIICKVHMKKISISDAIYVVCPDGYIGEYTEKEIEHAKRIGISVYYDRRALLSVGLAG